MDIDMSALRMVESEKGVSLDTLVTAIEAALLRAYHDLPGALPKARVEVDKRTGHVAVIATETDEDGNEIGEFDDTPSGFGRIATTTARSIIVQRLRNAEDDQVLGSFRDKVGQVVSGIVQQSRAGSNVIVKVGEFEAVLPESEQVPGERYRHGDWIRALVVRISRGEKGARVELSRRHPDLVRGLFTREVPEISSGDVVIESVAREAGWRTKIAVRPARPHINAKGACIGPMGRRVRAVMNELNHEKIDVINYSEDPEVFIANALSPAKVASVKVVPAEHVQAEVIVPDFQLSLAIGREGQNARLAARLTGAKIDIRSDAEIAAEEAALAQRIAAGTDPDVDLATDPATDLPASGTNNYTALKAQREAGLNIQGEATGEVEGEEILKAEGEAKVASEQVAANPGNPVEANKLALCPDTVETSAKSTGDES